jgi:MFS family permease
MSSLAAAMRSTFASLQVRNYRLYFLGQVISVSGSWMQRVAQAWLVLHLTSSGLALGIVTALQFVPMLLFGTWGGLLADRADKRRLLLGTQTAAGLLALILGGLTLTGAVQLWMVYLLSLLLGMVTAVDNPTRQAFVMEMVGREYVANAVALNSATFTSARVVGPAVAGVLIAAVGTGWCFLLNAASYGAVLIALAAMDPARLLRGAPLGRGRGQLREGLAYAWSTPELRTTLLLLALVGTLAFNFSVLMPLMARNAFHGDASTLGLLFSAFGLGSLGGALFTASRPHPSFRLLMGCLVLFGLLLAGSAAAPSFPLEAGLLVPMGVAAIGFQATGNSILQIHSTPTMRGRVMALYSVVFIGTTPIGAPIVGWLAQGFGPRAGLAMGAAASLVAAAVGLARGPWRGSDRPSREVHDPEPG